MEYGAVAPTRIPKQDSELVEKLAFRWHRSSVAQRVWAETAKKCVDFMEGRQWSAEDLASLEADGRPALKFNKIAPLVRLVTGYHRNNRIDLTVIPGFEGASNEDVAKVLTMTLKQIGDMNELPFVDAEVFLDGIMTGRGFYDTRLDFSDNDLGTITETAVDPFTVYLDADGDRYNLSKNNIIQVSKWLSMDDVEGTYGRPVRELVGGFTRGDAWTAFPMYGVEDMEEVHPVRNFGMEDDDVISQWENFRGLFAEHFVDPAQKNIRAIDSQYHVTEMCNVFIDLETGDKKPVPKTWSKEKVQKVLYYSQQKGNPITVDRRPVKRVRWTTMIGDVIVADDWSPYDTFTINGYFPYFRRGHTMGMIEDLIDPQQEINRRRTNQIEIVGRSANSGWLTHENALTPDQDRNLQENASAPGFNLKWKGETKPEIINNSPSLTAQKILEDSSEEDMREISGINESALGQLDRVQSGKALEARQRQAVIGIQMYMDNFSRTKKLLGKKQINLIQKHYTEQRMIRIQGEGQTDQREVVLNQPVVDEVTGAIREVLNNVTLGTYSIKITETPLSASFENAQFEEALMIFEKLGPAGAMLAQTAPDLLIDMSSLPRKGEWIERIQQAMGMQQQADQQAATEGGGQQQPPPSQHPALPVPQ